MTKLQTVAKTNVGRVRTHNEDSFIVGLDPHSESWILSNDEKIVGNKGVIFVIADGMGGENAGEIASEIAVQSIQAFIKTEITKDEPLPVEQIMEGALIYAHNRIKDACRDNADYIGMGTTATICLIKDDKIYISWIGDSRVYRYSPHGRVHNKPYFFNNLEILSEDHSKVWQMVRQGALKSLEEARVHHESNIITQSLGDLFRTPQPDSACYPIFKDDVILICTDGLNGMLDDETIEKILANQDKSLDLTAEDLISAANAAGGQDNTTLILTKVTDGKPFSAENVIQNSGQKTMKTEVSRKTNKVNLILVAIIIGLVILNILSFVFEQQILNFFSDKGPEKSEQSIPPPSGLIREDSLDILNIDQIKEDDNDTINNVHNIR